MTKDSVVKIMGRPEGIYLDDAAAMNSTFTYYFGSGSPVKYGRLELHLDSTTRIAVVFRKDDAES